MLPGFTQFVLVVNRPFRPQEPGVCPLRDQFWSGGAVQLPPHDPENPQPLSISWHPSLDEEDRVIEGNRMRLVLLVVLIVLLVGALPTWPYSAGWGYYPSGGLGLVLLIVLVLALMGRL